MHSMHENLGCFKWIEGRRGRGRYPKLRYACIAHLFNHFRISYLGQAELYNRLQSEHERRYDTCP